MTEEEFLARYLQFLEGTLDAEGIAELHAYQDEMQLEDQHWQGDPLEHTITGLEIAQRLQVSMDRKPGVLRHMRWTRAVAACFALGIGVSAYYFWHSHVNTNRSGAPAVAHTSPPTEKVWLTLANGRKISLSDAGKGVVAQSSGTSAQLQAKGQLAYTQHAMATRPDTNMVSTPHGTSFTLTLADGSRVHLNAGSSLRFPVYFAQDRRDVYLEGEAFFEVNANAIRPFTVHVQEQEIQALGTSFNIKAFDPHSTRSTLLSGAVHVLTPERTLVLHPGQQAYFDGAHFTTRPADTEVVTAWMHGQFAFDNERLGDVLADMQHWYGIELVHGTGNFNRRFTGRIDHYTHIEDALKRLEFTGALRYELTQQHIVITVL